MKKKYKQQVQLLLEVLPTVFENKNFALKGGTAINLFYRNMPRYSVDIDLCYLPLKSRNATITAINSDLKRMKDKLESMGLLVQSSHNLSNSIGAKLTVSNNNASIKIEPNYILRGSVYTSQSVKLCKDAENEFELNYSTECLNIADIYGGKLCAALDRQHPRDLFDVMVLFNNEGITEEIKNSFIYHLLSTNRSIHELLNPNKVHIKEVYEKEFKEMATVETSLDLIEKTRDELFSIIRTNLSKSDKQFLLSFVQNEPNWELYAFPKIKDYPSIKWKLLNQSKMNEQKSKDYIKKVKQILNI